MHYIYIRKYEDGFSQLMTSGTEPSPEIVASDVITIQSLPIKPRKEGHGARLCANFETKEVWYELVPSAAYLKQNLIKALEEYDSSSKVNEFTIGDIKLWLDSSMRDKVRENLEYCKQVGLTETTLRISGHSFTLTTEQGWQMYYAVLGYARECWNVTEMHREAIMKLRTEEEIKGYNYTTGYPEKLVFNL